MLDENDFNVSYTWMDDGQVMYIDHLWLDEAHRGNGSFIIETLVRVAYSANEVSFAAG